MNRILRIVAFQDPEFYKAQAIRLSTFDKPRVIGCGEDLGKQLALPRGCLADVIELLQSLKIKAEVRDERFAGSPIEAAFHGILRVKQQEAVDAIIQHDNGFLCAPTAFGKTAVALVARFSEWYLVLWPIAAPPVGPVRWYCGTMETSGGARP